MPNQDTTTEWVQVGRLLRPQGRMGELLMEPQTDQLQIFAPGATMRLGPAPFQASAKSVRVESCWEPTGRNAGRLVVKLAETDSISAAEALAGNFLWIPAQEMPTLEDGTFFVRDLLGCELYDGERLAGTVVDLQYAIGADGRTRLSDAADLLVVETPGGSLDQALLIPFVRAWLDSVNLESRKIHMHLPEGLLAELSTAGEDA